MGKPFGDGICAHLIALSNQSAAANCAASAIFLIAVSFRHGYWTRVTSRITSSSDARGENAGGAPVPQRQRNLM